MPVEITEAITPLVFWRKEFAGDSGGAGRVPRRARPGDRVIHLDNAPFMISANFDRVIFPPRGRDGGANGRPASCAAARASCARQGQQTMPAGESYVIEAPGGGGLGDPKRRVPARWPPT